MTVEWKHRKAETEVEPLLRAAARLDPTIHDTFPRSIKDILCATLSVAFESHARLTLATVVDVLGDRYGIDHRDALTNGDAPLAGYTFARGEMAVVFSDSQHGEGFERFTLAHEAGHIAVEYLPALARSGQAELFGGDPSPAFYARRDPLGHIFLGGGTPSKTSEPGKEYLRLRSDETAWRREIVANACAAELLAPYREVRRVVAALTPEADRCAALQVRFGLSRRAAQVRLAELRIISDISDQLLFLVE